jgi:glutathione S-transferase
MIELYQTPQSTCSQKVRFVLTEKDVPWTERRIDWLAGEHLEDWYLKINPNGVVPTLVHDGHPVLDSSVINEYLEEVFPETPLMPATPLERARMRTWRQFIDEVPTVAIRAPSFNAALVELWKGMSDSEFEAFAVRHPLRADFYRKMGTTGFSQDEIDASQRRLSYTLERMEQALKGGGPWLLGEQFTLADISLIPTLVRMEDLGMSDLWSSLPDVAGWLERIKARPSFPIVYTGVSRALSREYVISAGKVHG